MIEITRRIEFDAGHRVLGHGGKCRFLHGHRYRAEITVTAPELNDLGMVTDFGQIKEVVGGWVDENWDHNMLLNPDDPLINAIHHLNRHCPLNHECADWSDWVLGRNAYVMPSIEGGEEKRNPTAENIAEDLYNVSRNLLVDLEVVRVRIYETPNCFADYFEL